jgi:ureidoacrylate peracid hydrolase
MRTVNGASVFSTVEEILAPSHTALLIVDMQNDMCHPDGWFSRQGRDGGAIRSIVPAIRVLLDAARDSGVLPVFIEQTTLPDNGSDPPGWLYFKTRDGRTRTDYTLDGSWGQAVLEELRPDPTDIIVKKNRPSAFHATNLDLILRSHRVESVLVTGCVTQGCVLATTLGASFAGYYTVLCADAVQSHSPRQHEVALEFLGSRYDLVGHADVAALWRSPRATGQAGRAAR